jgi:hypothetical protein
MFRCSLYTLGCRIDGRVDKEDDAIGGREILSQEMRSEPRVPGKINQLNILSRE